MKKSTVLETISETNQLLTDVEINAFVKERNIDFFPFGFIVSSTEDSCNLKAILTKKQTYEEAFQLSM